MTSIRSTRGVRKEAGECCMTRWAYGVEPEASAPPPLHVRCAGCGARCCCCCLETSADVFESVQSRKHHCACACAEMGAFGRGGAPKLSLCYLWRAGCNPCLYRERTLPKSV